MARSSYGLPYSGSKNFIAKYIIDNIPPCDHFYDLFGGGGAITHYALLSDKFKFVHYNEINPLVADTFSKAIDGYYNNEDRWISREDFFKLKDTDGYVALCFSFSNDMRSYAYGKTIEEKKKVLHYYRLNKIKSLADDNHFKISENLEHLNRIQNLEHLNRIQNLEHLNRYKKNGSLIITNNDYRDVVIQDNSVIYCDPPYVATKGYDSTGKKYNAFDTTSFLDWASKQKNIYISETQTDDRFECVWERQKRVLTDGSRKLLYRTEKLFTIR